MKKLSRRDFLLGAGICCAGLALTACGAQQHADIAYDSSSMSLPASALPSASPSAAASSTAASSAAWDTAGYTDALNTCIGWGGDAGSSLKSVIAACALLDWGEDNAASKIGADAMQTAASSWLSGLDDDGRSTFAEDWGSISGDAQNLLIDPDGMAGLLSDAGNPNRHSHYTDANWTEIQSAIDGAMSAASLSVPA